jgi:sigma-B regulation protein RsbU (phosphoserine phosphatase)
MNMPNGNPLQGASSNFFDSSAKEQERTLNNKLIELQALFEISQILNSSLNLKSILDNMLLTPMGKMMISKGVILLHKEREIYAVETLKGLSRTLIGKQVVIENSFINPTLVPELDETECSSKSFFSNLGIELLLPISSNKRALGIIGLGHKITGGEYSQPELDFLNSLSNIAATSIENGLIFNELNHVNKKLDKKIQELNTLFEIGKELNATLEVDKILNLLIYAIMGEMVVNRCAILLKKNSSMQLQVSKGMGEIDQEIKDHLTPEIQHALLKLEQPVLVSGNHSPALQIFADINFHVIVPMQLKDEVHGIILIGPKIIKQNFQEDELEFLNTLGNQAMISLENARLFEETLEKQRMEEELNIAHEIQQALLPKNLPRFEHFDLAGINVPSRQVGGDYYDCIQIDDTHYGIAIADVSGKGVPAALLMANVQASLHALVGTQVSIPTMFYKINNLTHQNTTPDKFITFFYGILDTDQQTFTFCNAGHNPPYLFKNCREFQLLEDGGLLLGMLPNCSYRTGMVTLAQNDWLVLYTDGVNEAINPAGEEFDTWRIEEVIEKNKNETAQTLLEAILAAIKNFVQDVPQSDDITLVVIKVN